MLVCPGYSALQALVCRALLGCWEQGLAPRLLGAGFGLWPERAESRLAVLGLLVKRDLSTPALNRGPRTSLAGEEPGAGVRAALGRSGRRAGTEARTAVRAVSAGAGAGAA